MEGQIKNINFNYFKARSHFCFKFPQKCSCCRVFIIYQKLWNVYLSQTYLKLAKLFEDNMMYAGVKNERRYVDKEEKPSKVLLVCVYDTVVLEVTNEAVRGKFQSFGKITKLLIFERGEVTKMFIQYQQIEHAIKAKNRLDGTKLCETICKLTIYFSNFSNVDTRDQIEETKVDPIYWDNCGKTDTRQDQYLSPQYSTKTNQLFFSTDIDDDFIMKTFNPFDGFHRSKTDQGHFLKKQIHKMSLNFGNVVQQNAMMLPSQKSQTNWKVTPMLQAQIIQKRQQDTALKLKQDTDTRSSVIWFNYRYELEPKFIYNIHSNFGNISCITIKKQQVYIKFRTKQFAAMASTYLNDTDLMGNIMSIRECPEDSKSWMPTQGEYSETHFYDSNSDRFTPHRSITINPPSQTIHVSSIKRQICKQNSLRNIFSKYGVLQKIHIIQHSNDKNMALVKFATLSDSLNAIANLHNESFSGRKLQISFTKSKV